MAKYSLKSVPPTPTPGTVSISTIGTNMITVAASPRLKNTPSKWLLNKRIERQGERTKPPPLLSPLGPGRDQGRLQTSGCALPGTRRKSKQGARQ